jgi:hypothetical protein
MGKAVGGKILENMRGRNTEEYLEDAEDTENQPAIHFYLISKENKTSASEQRTQLLYSVQCVDECTLVYKLNHNDDHT